MVTPYEYAQLSSAAYDNPDAGLPNHGYTLPSGWAYLADSNSLGSSNDGYFGVAFRKGDEVIIVHRGTEPDSINDLYADFQIKLGDFPTQYTSGAATNLFSA